MIRIGNTGIDRAHSRTLGFVERPHTLRAFVVFDLVNFIASKYRFVRAFGLTSSAIDTFFVDFIRHIKASSKKIRIYYITFLSIYNPELFIKAVEPTLFPKPDVFLITQICFLDGDGGGWHQLLPCGQTNLAASTSS
jgi:hypothetical protein